ncbi:hypothetical protein [Pseudarthrobacter sp. NIBRBAC000502770]|uniref:hypothetical protein n=1 Tax=Pseudarthrobacter sp. NIBRBAC000502770 TaxID=2590785 RepID=UPI001140095B|nr:hypothetical protein [Pseudarthrobacter sp. NIBRBAC000502770]QDG89093.1 hypothetical protein NIBR502770_11850 [Pseudarthrobacter sp. NIBRBAC000502770]
MPDSTAPHYALAQDLKAGQTFVQGRGGKHWTAMEDADTVNMRRSTRTGDLLVAIPVTFRGTPQGMPLSVPLDKIVRLINNGDPT